MSLPKFGEGIALLLDSAPRTWTSQEERHLELCRALTNLNITLVLVYAEKLSPAIEDRLRNAGAMIEVAAYRGAPYQYFRAVRKIIDNYSVAIVHICFFDYFSLVPWIVRLTGMRTLLFEQQNSGVLKATSWRQTLIRLRGTIATYPVSQVIAISEFVKQELVKCGVGEDKVIVRYLGVSTDRFKPDLEAKRLFHEKYAIAAGEVVISTVSVMRAFKNPRTIIDACGLLGRRGIPFRLFVAGDGELIPDLKQLALDYGIEKCIHWLGYCEDPMPLLQASDIFVLASIGEAFGLVLAEAMSCGVPVVGSTSGAIPEIVHDGNTGFLASPQDPTAFAAAIEKLVVDIRLRREMGARSRDRISREFAVDLEVKNTIAIYEKLAS